MAILRSPVSVLAPLVVLISAIGCGTRADEATSTSAASSNVEVRAAALSWANTCVVTRLGAAECWGDDYFGQLGDGAHTNSYHPALVQELGADVDAISAAGSYACALSVHGAVKCWGLNTNGQLGNGTTDSSSAVPTDVVGLGSGVVAIAAGDDHACALIDDGRVKCWGANDLGQLGNGTNGPSNKPVDVAGLGGRVQAIATSGSHTCALTTQRAVKCWGAGARGQLGNGATADSAMPVPVQGLGTGVRAIAAGLEHSCAVIDRDGSVQCWGRNDFGQLGNGTTTDAAAPKPVQGIGSQVAMLASGGYHNCVITNSGAARCWGLGLAGQLGNGDASAQASAPVAVQGLDRQVTSIALGLYHSCATTGAGALVCWGENGSGALGVDESTEKSAVPISVSP